MCISIRHCKDLDKCGFVFVSNIMMSRHGLKSKQIFFKRPLKLEKVGNVNQPEENFFSGSV